MEEQNQEQHVEPSQNPVDEPVQEPQKFSFLSSKWLKVGIGTVFVLVLLGGAYLLGQNTQKQEEAVISTPSPTPIDETENWKTLDSSKDIALDFYPSGERPIDFTLKYPSNWLFEGNALYPEGKGNNPYPVKMGLGYWGSDLPQATDTTVFPAGEADYFWGGDSYIIGYAKFGNGNIFSLTRASLSKSDEYQKIFNKILNTLKFTDSSDETANWKIYTNSQEGFSFKYPPDWGLSEKSGVTNGVSPYLSKTIKGDIYPALISILKFETANFSTSEIGMFAPFDYKVLNRNNNTYVLIAYSNQIGTGASQETEKVAVDTLTKIYSTFRFD